MSDVQRPTEARNPRTVGMDEMGAPELVALLAREQRTAAIAVESQASAIAGALDAIVPRIRAGGRLHYVGAGSSGRLGVLDASEMPPTFGVDATLVCAHIAGGEAALRSPVEGAEDDADAGAREMRGHVASGDAVVALSASGGAAYVVAALRAAREIGALTVAIVNAHETPLAQGAEHRIVLETGAEPLAGSTRMIAGTAQKIALNTLSTALMVRLGKVHGNVMIDVVPSNRKLRDRGLALVQVLAKVDRERARTLLEAAEWRVKVAVVMQLRELDAPRARALLEEHDGVLGRAL